MIATETHTKTQSVPALIDEAFDRNQTDSYELFLELSASSVAYAILDPAKRKLLVFAQIPITHITHDVQLAQEVLALIKKDELLNKKYKRVVVSVISRMATIVPEALYNETAAKTCFELNYPLDEQSELLTDSFKGLDAKNVYSVHKKILAVLHDQFPGVRITHFSTSLIDALLSQYRNTQGKNLVIHVQPDQFEAIVIEGKKLWLYNSFNYKTPEDFIYYVLFVCEQLKLNPETVELTLLGKVERNSALYDYLHKYIRNVKFGERPAQYEYTYKLNNVAKHQLYSLFCLS